MDREAERRVIWRFKVGVSWVYARCSAHSPFLHQRCSPSGTQPAPTSFLQFFKMNPCTCALGWTVSLAVDSWSPPPPLELTLPRWGWCQPCLNWCSIKVPEKQTQLGPVWRLRELWQSDSEAIFSPIPSTDGSRKATECTQGTLMERLSSVRADAAVARPPSFFPVGKGSYREPPSLLPPLTSQLPSSWLWCPACAN